VTGDEAAKVTAGVLKDADGSHDVFGPKDGNPMGYDVSTDLKTVTVGEAGHRGGHGAGRGARPAPSTSSSGN
jgi:hypothetical protein